MNHENIIALNPKAAFCITPGERVCFDEKGNPDCEDQDAGHGEDRRDMMFPRRDSFVT